MKNPTAISTGPVPLGSIVQVCYVTRDLSKAIADWSLIGAGPFFVIDNLRFENRRYRGAEAHDTIIAAIGNLGATMIELVQPTNDAPSIFQEILAEKGEAIHHIYPGIKPLTDAEFEAKYNQYVAAGFAPVLTFEVPGRGRNVFFDAKHAYGCFIELIQYNEAGYRIVRELMALHLAWDRSRPERPFAELLELMAAKAG